MSKRSSFIHEEVKIQIPKINNQIPLNGLHTCDINVWDRMWNAECLAENGKIQMNNESTKTKVDTNMYYARERSSEWGVVVENSVVITYLAHSQLIGV